MSRNVPLAPGMKVDFNALKPPPGYVPGMGRGASGFTTRSDIGPAMPAAGVPLEPPVPQNDDAEFDPFLGNDAGVFGGGGKYDKEDEEADAVWASIDKRLGERGQARRQAKLREELKKYHNDNPQISVQFSDLKRKLGEVSETEWDAIPDIGDYTIKKKKYEQFTPVPDSLLAKAHESVSALEKEKTLKVPEDITAVGAGRNTVVQLKLDTMADSVSGQTVVDPKGYLTDLKSVQLKSDAEISDIKKARLLLKSVIHTNPHHAPGWIAAARLEEVAGKLQAARELAMKGCELCPKNEDVWLEAARLQTLENAKAILARAIASLPGSVKLWLEAAKQEESDKAKKRVILRGLERIPESVRLWKAVVELSDEDDARILLSRAVECCPQHVELWLALARLETYKNAQKILNKARQAIPTSQEVWITACKLEEANGNISMPDKIVPRALKSLQAHGVVISREWWLREAEAAERSDPPMIHTCRAIVHNLVGHDIEAEDREPTWVADAEESAKKGAVETARAILSHTLEVFPGKVHVWRQAADFEKKHGTSKSLDTLLRRAVQYCPEDEILWLMGAKEKWLEGDVPGARAILEEAFARNPDSEEIWIAAAKVEWESGEFERARVILSKARNHPPASTPRVWMKSAALERDMGNEDDERSLLKEGIRRFPHSWKLHMMLGQLEERLGGNSGMDAARKAYHAGLQKCVDCIPLWVKAANLETKSGSVSKARALLEQARHKNPKNDVLWLEAVRTERGMGQSKAADALLAKALQECPDSGKLWSEAILTAPRPARKSKSVDALKKCDNNPYVIAAVAQLFWQERKLDKARSWFHRAVSLDPDIGDHWALYYAFEKQHGSPETSQAVLRRCVEAEPHHGEQWQAISKSPSFAHKKTESILKAAADAVS